MKAVASELLLNNLAREWIEEREQVMMPLRVNIALLKKQRNWLLKQSNSPEANGIINLLDEILDEAEGFADRDRRMALKKLQNKDITVIQHMRDGRPVRQYRRRR